MKSIIIGMLCLIGAASAFVAPQTVASTAQATALQATSPPIASAIAGAVPAIVTSSAAFATEGTNEWFGVDDLRVLGVLFAGHLFILSLYVAQYGEVDEEDDFFGEIDYGALSRGDQIPIVGERNRA